MDILAKKKESEYYNTLIRWNNKYLRRYSDVFKRLDEQLNYYNSFDLSKVSSRGAIITRARIRALKRAKCMYQRHYNTIKRILDGYGYVIVGDCIYFDDKYIGYLTKWKIAARKQKLARMKDKYQILEVWIEEILNYK